jgi:hypothetical protein
MVDGLNTYPENISNSSLSRLNEVVRTSALVEFYQICVIKCRQVTLTATRGLEAGNLEITGHVKS